MVRFVKDGTRGRTTREELVLRSGKLNWLGDIKLTKSGDSSFRAVGVEIILSAFGSKEELEEMGKIKPEAILRNLKVLRSRDGYLTLDQFEVAEGESAPKIFEETELTSFLSLLAGNVWVVADIIMPMGKSDIRISGKETMTAEDQTKLSLEEKEIQFGPLEAGQKFFLPLEYVAKRFKDGFEQFCLVQGLIVNGHYFELKRPYPKDYETLIESLKKLGLYVV